MNRLWYRILSLFGLPKKARRIKTSAIPHGISKSFYSMFEGAEQVQWYILRGEFESRFVLKNKRNRAYYTTGGTLVHHYCQTSIKSIPRFILNKIARSFNGYSIVEIYFDQNHPRPTYKIEFKKNAHVIYSSFDHNGNLLSQLNI